MMNIAPIGYSDYSPVQNISSQTPVREKEKGGQELTTVTTHCNMNHQHNQSCPHSTYTRPAPKAGEPGSIINMKI